MTPDEALANAIRILTNAEMETNLLTMQQLEGLADSWIGMAAMMKTHDWLSSTTHD